MYVNNVCGNITFWCVINVLITVQFIISFQRFPCDVITGSDAFAITPRHIKVSSGTQTF